MNPSSNSNAPKTAVGELTKYLTFQLDAEEFGVRIIKVREIVRMMPITRIPRMPDYVVGVVNLRGQVIPIIDLRTRFGLPKREPVDETRIIVAELAIDGDISCTGFVVDRVKEVIAIPADVIEPPPQSTKSDKESFVVGLAKLRDSVTALLEVDRLLSETGRLDSSELKAA